MRRVFLWAVLNLLLHTTLLAQATKEQIQISVKHDNDASEVQTKSQLQKLLAQYDLSRFIFRQVLDEGDKIRAVLRKYKLVI